MRKSIRALALVTCLAAIPVLSYAANTHKVKKNETLYSLARKYQVSVDDLKSANNLVSAQVKNGDVLIIPQKTKNPAETPTTSNSVEAVKPDSTQAASESVEKPKPSVYKVKRNEVLSRISKKTGVSVAELKRLNNLTSSKVKAGKTLVLREGTVNEEAAKAESQTAKSSQRYSLRHKEIFSEKDYDQSLADLTASDPGKPESEKLGVEEKADSVNKLKSTAFSFLGTRYRFGGSSLNGLDCSAFVQKVFRELEVSLPRSAREQFHVGDEVMQGDLQKGDLVFFRTYASFPSHVGIYLGNNKMIHASSRDRRVVISSMNSQYYRARYLGAKRISKINPDVFKFDDLLMGIEEETPNDAGKNDTMGLSLKN